MSSIDIDYFDSVFIFRIIAFWKWPISNFYVFLQLFLSSTLKICCFYTISFSFEKNTNYQYSNKQNYIVQCFKSSECYKESYKNLSSLAIVLKFWFCLLYCLRNLLIAFFMLTCFQLMETHLIVSKMVVIFRRKNVIYLPIY